MSILDENNFDKFVIENSFTIDNENYKDEHSIKIRRDNELNIILNKETVTSYKPLNRNSNVVASMPILGKGQARHILKNVYFYSLKESINLSYNKTKINSEAFVESIEWSSETFKNSEYIVEFIDNIPINHFWSDTVDTEITKQTNIKIGNIKIEEIPENSFSFVRCLNLKIDNQEVYLSRNEEKSGKEYTNGTVLYKGNPSKELRDKIRNILSFFIGRILILLEESNYDIDWNITYFKAYTPHNTMNSRAFKINTILPLPLNNELNNKKIDSKVLSKYLTAFFYNYDLCDFNHISWLYWHAQCSALHTKCGELGATLEALQKAYIDNNKIGWSNSIIEKKEFKKLRKEIRDIIFNFNITDENKQNLEKKLNFNQLSQIDTLKKLFEHLDISLGELELKAWQGRNDSAHGGKMKDYSIEKLVKQTDLIQGVFHKLILTISVNTYEYYDYYSDSIGVRSNRKIQLKEINEFNLSSNSRENWQENIKEVLEKNKDKKDEGIISELLDDSDLEDF